MKAKATKAQNQWFQEMLMKNLSMGGDEETCHQEASHAQDHTTNTNNQKGQKGQKDHQQDHEECKITGERLTHHPKNYYRLTCGHAFVYHAIFNEVCYQKRYHIRKHKAKTVHVKLTMNDKYYRNLNVNQFLCPYCRKLQIKLLPSWDTSRYPRTYGVNSPPFMTNKVTQCCNHILTRGPRKGQPCNKETEHSYCPNHAKQYASKKEDVKAPTAPAETVENEDDIETDEEALFVPIVSAQQPQTSQQAQKSQSMHKQCTVPIKTGKRKGQPCHAKAKTWIDVNGTMVCVCGRHVHSA